MVLKIRLVCNVLENFGLWRVVFLLIDVVNVFIDILNVRRIVVVIFMIMF